MTPSLLRVSRRRVWGEAGVVFVGFLLVYLTLGQSVFYKGDGPWIVKRLIDGSTDYPHHKLYMPMLVAFGDLVAPLGMTPYRTGVVFSAVGSALGVCLAHVAFRWLVPGRAWLATLLLGLCPAVLLFATVVEFHGVLLGFAGIAFLLAAHLAIKPGWIVAVALGIATSVAAGVHSSGLVLPGVLLPWFLARRWHIGTRQHDLLLCGIAGALHLGGAFLLAKPDQATHVLETGFSHPQGIEHLPGILHVEWLTAFFPLSIVVFAAAFRRGLRLQLLAFVIGMAPYRRAASARRRRRVRRLPAAARLRRGASDSDRTAPARDGAARPDLSHVRHRAGPPARRQRVLPRLRRRSERSLRRQAGSAPRR